MTGLHARIATVRVRAGSAPDVERIWRQLLDVYRETGVFRGLVSLHSTEDDVAVTLTFWRSAEAADEAASALRARAAEAFAGVLLEAPRIEPFDVLVATPPFS